MPRFNFFRKSALSCLCCTIYICRSAFPHLLLLPSPNLYLLLLLIENGRLHVQTHERNRPIWNPDISSSICVSLNQDSLERGLFVLVQSKSFHWRNFVCKGVFNSQLESCCVRSSVNPSKALNSGLDDSV